MLIASKFCITLRAHCGTRRAFYSVLLALSMALMAACSPPSVAEAPTSLALQVRVPASTTEAAAAETEPHINALELVGAEFGLVMVDDRELSSGGAFRSRFS